MEQNLNKRFIQWRDIDDAIERLVSNITISGVKIHAVKGIPRGGLVPAVMLSHRLKVPMVKDEVLGNNVLVVDDICDSGTTLKKYKEYQCITLTLHYKNSAIVEPNFWWKLASENEWIVYPWENKDSQTIADYATTRK